MTTLSTASKMRLFASGFAACMLACTTVGAPPESPRNPGHEYGRTNCGRAPGTGGLRSQSACKRCCNTGAQDGAYDASGLADCQRFCRNAYWN
ncbi:MAG: hypothetical protein SFZ24_08295 [Planctomycetota bacterium]|nr:hypothetical protein [Planctomycetota bacterium]